MQGRVETVCFCTQQCLTVHLAPEAGDVAATEVFTQVADLLQLKQVNPQNLNGLHHLITQAQGVTAVSEHRQFLRFKHHYCCQGSQIFYMSKTGANLVAVIRSIQEFKN